MSTLDALPDRVSAGRPGELRPLAGGDLELLGQAHEAYRKLEREIGRVIIGQEAIVRSIVAAVFSQGHTLIIGVPGLAKTLLVKTVSQVLSWSFKRIQFTPDMMPADIIGMELLQEDPATGARSMRFVPGPLFANLILADEINRTPPKTQSALLEAMQEQTVTSMGKPYRLAQPFIVFATQNPIEQEGTYPLPEAQLDRFMFSLWMGYPSREEEENIVLATTEEAVPTVEPVCSLEQITAFQQLVRRVPVSRHVVTYAVALARSSRPDTPDALPYVRQYVSWGRRSAGQSAHDFGSQGAGRARRPTDRLGQAHPPGCAAGSSPSRATQLQRGGRRGRFSRHHPAHPRKNARAELCLISRLRPFLRQPLSPSPRASIGNISVCRISAG
jgi:MoxR-like ATPase